MEHVEEYNSIAGASSRVSFYKFEQHTTWLGTLEPDFRAVAAAHLQCILVARSGSGSDHELESDWDV
jgi:hypothetical protein